MGPAHLTTEVRGGITVVTACEGLFDEIHEDNASAPLAAEVVAEEQTLSVTSELARELSA